MRQALQILVVDDEPSVRKSLKLLLKHDGHVVSEADDGEAALAELAQRKFDLVLTDFSMPGMHGDELVARIRELIPTQPIILATAFVDEYKTFGDTSARPDAMLLKPFTFSELREAIEQVLHLPQPGQTTGVQPGMKSYPDLRSFL